MSEMHEAERQVMGSISKCVTLEQLEAIQADIDALYDHGVWGDAPYGRLDVRIMERTAEIEVAALDDDDDEKQLIESELSE